MPTQVNGTDFKPSAYEFYQAAMEATSKNRGSSVVKLGSKNFVISRAATSRTSTLTKSTEAFRASLVQAFGKVAADRGMDAIKKGSQSLSARNITLAFRTAQETFETGTQTHEIKIGDQEWVSVDHDSSGKFRNKIASALADRCMKELKEDDYKTIAGKSGVALPESFNFTDKNAVRTYFSEAMQKSPEWRNFLNCEGKIMTEVEKSGKKDANNAARSYIYNAAQKFGKYEECRGINEQFSESCNSQGGKPSLLDLMTVNGEKVEGGRKELLDKLKNLPDPGKNGNFDKALYLATTFCTKAHDVKMGGHFNGYSPISLDLSVAKGEDGKNKLVLTQKYRMGPEIRDFFGVKIPGDDILLMADAKLTVEIDIDNPVKHIAATDEYIPNFGSHVEIGKVPKA